MTPPVRPLRTRDAQRGVVLLFALIALAILLVGAVALVRSSTANLFTAGNLAFKQDLSNQGERAVPLVMAALRTGALSNADARAANQPAQNYSALMLPVNEVGIPTALLANDATFQGAWTAPDIIPTDASGRPQGVRVRYIVDRLCSVAGNESTLGDQCARSRVGVRSGSPQLQAADLIGGQPIVYRLTVRVDGPRGTQSFFQTTFSL